VRRAVDNTAILLKAARAARAPVAQSYTATTSARDSLHWKVKPVSELVRRSWEGCQLDTRIHDPGYDMVCCKQAPSIFFGATVASFFAKEQVDTVFVIGCTTSGCVRASVVDAFSFGFRVMAPEPCCGAPEPGGFSSVDLATRRR
jgi:maleamate amidohydrolase